MIRLFSGIDIQINRGCSYYVIDQNKNYVTSGWIKESIPQSFKDLFNEISGDTPNEIAIGIDAPRMPIKKLRTRYFNKSKNNWTEKTKKSVGRECEVIIKSYNIANPQWTRTFKESPGWMKLGYAVYKTLNSFPFVYEVFPSASYKMLQKENIAYELCLNNFTGGVKDMLDASVAAITVFEFISGRGFEAGGADGLGTIILPRKFSSGHLSNENPL